MELRQLENFLAVVDTGTFTRAAGLVHLGQSALSVSIRTLEADLGVRLFDRTTRRVQLTDAGVALAVWARELLATAAEARAAVDAVTGGMAGTVRVGFMHSMTAVDLPGIVAAFRHERPGVRLELSTHPDGSTGLVEAIIQGRLDLAVAATTDRPPREVSARELTREPIHLACSPQHPFAGRGQVAIRDLEDGKFVDLPPGWGSRVAVDGLFTRTGVRREVFLNVADVDTVVAFVRAGVGLALLAPSSIPNRDGIALIPTRPAAHFAVSLVTSNRRPPTAAVKAFADVVKAASPRPSGVKTTDPPQSRSNFPGAPSSAR